MKLALCLVAALLWPLAAPAQSPAADPAPATSALDAPLFYQVLLGEINAQGSNPSAGFALLLDAARTTNDADLYQRAVDLALQARAGDAALQAARAWQQAQPESRAAAQTTLQILVALNQVNEIAPLITLALTTSPAQDREALITSIPAGLMRLTDKVAASSVVEQALAPYLSDAQLGATAWVTVGRMRLQARNPQGTLEAINHAQSLNPRAPGPALLSLELMRPEIPQAEALVLRYLKQADAAPNIRIAYALTLLEANRMAEGQEQLQLLTTSQPSYAPGWLALGLKSQQSNQPDIARPALLRFLDLTPLASTDQEHRGKTQALLALSQIAEKSGRLAEAADWLDRIEPQADDLGLVSRRATLLAKQGQLAQGRALIQSYPERTAADARLKLLAEVQLLQDNQQFAAAFDVLGASLAAEPNDPELLYEQSMVADKMGRPELMERLLRQAIALKPDYYHAYNALGYSLADRNERLDEARVLVKKALSYAPQDPMVQDSWGWVEFRSGHYAEAVQILRTAFQAQPDPEIGAHLGEALWQNHQRTEAQAIWAESLRRNPDSEVLQATMRRLRAQP
jgi:predicted Zn-dependent protease